MEMSSKAELAEREEARDTTVRKKKGIHLSYCEAGTLLVCVILVIVGVGLMAGLLRKPCPQYTTIEEPVPQEPPHDKSGERSHHHEKSHHHDHRKIDEGPEDPEDGYFPVYDWIDESILNDQDSSSSNSKQDLWLNPFLPEYIYPVHYDLYQYPDFYFDGSTFTGRITIEVHLEQDSPHILIHIKMMTITFTDVQTLQGDSLPLNRTFAYDPNQYWVIELVNPILAGTTVKVTLDFTGSLENGIVGYYKSTYVNSVTGLESWLATTKFQPSDSRKAFPNFDEPRYKATFNVTLRHWANFTALGNMPIYNERAIDATWMETTFQKSPVMSSYLVCFIVCDFQKKDDVLVSGTPISVWAQPDKIDQVDYALSMGKTVMDNLEALLQIPFHLPKLDNLAVPDYPSGATEHWGLITYRVSRVLYDPTQVSDSDKQSVLFIIAHEMAHNYFGNSITCKWWDDLWLNEGFAVYYEYRESDKADPEFNAAGQFVIIDQQFIMEYDGSNSSRPLLIAINTPNDANAAFDGITYSKGASMLRMMEGFLTTTVFDQGARNMLNDFVYQSVVTQDLWDSMQKNVTNGLNITQIMQPWVYQSGLPVIDVTIEGSNLRATQRRFMKDPDADPTMPPSPFNYKWFVPLSYITESGASDLLWINGVDSITFPDPTGGVDWIKFNEESNMYYRVNYDASLLSRITQQIQEDYTAFSPVDRSNILDDGLNIARAGQAPYEGILNLTMYMTGEVGLEPWRAAKNGLSYISDIFYITPHNSLFRDYIQRISTPRMNQLQVEDGGTHMEKLNREDIIILSCGHGYGQCLQNTSRFFADWLTDDVVNAVPLNIRRVVYAYGMQVLGGDEAFDIMWNRYTTSTSGQEADNILYGMTYTTKLWHISTLLDYSMDETKIRSQDFFTLIEYLADNKDANRHVWDWARVNYDAIVARFGLDNRSLGGMIPDIVSGYSTEGQLQEVEAFYAQHPDPGTGAQSRADSLDSIQNNIKWRARSEQEIVDWLIKYI